MNEFLELFIQESESNVKDFESTLLKIEKDYTDEQLISDAMRFAHSIKGGASFFEYTQIVRVAHKLEDILTKITKNEFTIDDTLFDLLLAGSDLLGRMVYDVANLEQYDEESVELSDKLAELENRKLGKDTTIEVNQVSYQDALTKGAIVYRYNAANNAQLQTNLQMLKDVAEIIYLDEKAKKDVETPIIFVTDLKKSFIKALFKFDRKDMIKLNEEDFNAFFADKQPAVKEEVKPKKKTAKKAAKKPAVKKEVVSAAEAPIKHEVEETVKIKVKVLDELLNNVGEIVLSRNNLSALIDRDAEKATLETAVSNLTRLTSLLQDQVMRTRMRKVGLVFNKFPRVIRDLSKQLGKEMVLNMEGTEVELDKTIIDLIHDPLTQILRHAVDHGVETPDVRKKAGKPAVGTVNLSATIDSGRATITVTDDGKGIDAEALRKKIVEKELLDQAAADLLTESQVINYIFEPAFSTHEQVTDISGRGVGMNVVKTNLEQLNAQISIDTEVGKGTKFTFKIPLTIAIINGVIVKFNENQFIIPQSAVKEFVDVELNDKCRVDKSKDVEFLYLRDEIIPIVNIFKLANPDKELPAVNNPKYVIVQSGSIKLALLVTSIEKIEETLIKNLPQVLRRELYSSLTISSLGEVIPIINTEGILKLAGISEKQTQKVEKTSEEIVEYDTYLQFIIGDQNNLMIPVEKVERLMKIDVNDIHKVLGDTFYYVQDTQYKIIDVAEVIKLESRTADDFRHLILVKGETKTAILVDGISSTVNIPTTVEAQDVFKEGLRGSMKGDNNFVGIAIDTDYFLRKGGM
jgi:two-component system chemotaxis sensor kinase CheA